MARKPLNMKALNRKVVKSGKALNDALENMIETSAVEADEIGRAAMIELHGDFVRTVPKDTGRAAAGFIMQQLPTEEAPGPGEYNDSLAGLAQQAAQNVSEIPRGGTITISNNVVYLPPLENGHSQQAPRGFIVNALNNFSARLNRAAAEFNKRRIQ